MATHAPITRKLRIKLGGQIVHRSTGYSTERTPSGDTSSAGTVDINNLSPASRALCILGKMGSGRLPLMASLPADFADLSQRVTAKQQRRAQATDTEARPSSAAPPRPFSAGLKGKLEKAEGRLKAADAGTKGKAKQAEAPSKPSNAGVRDKTEKAAGDAKPAAKGKAEKADSASRPFDAGTKGNSDRPKGLPQASSSTLRASGLSKEVPARLNGVGKATKDDQANGHTNGHTNGQASGQASGKGKDEKAEGPTTKGQKRPAWGAPLPPAKAAKDSEARTFKRLKKSASPPEAEVVDHSVPSKLQPQQPPPPEDSTPPTPPEPMVDVPAKKDTVGAAAAAMAATAAAADVKPSSKSKAQPEASARPPQPSLHPPVDPPSLPSAKPAAQDPSPSPGQTPAAPPLVWLNPNPPAVSAAEPETAQSGALPSAYANLPEKATAPLGKSKSMQPRSVAVGAAKVPLKVIRPQIPGMTKAPSPSIAGASTLIGEARRHLEAGMHSTSAPQAGATAQHAQHSMPADSLPPSSSSAGTAAGKPVAIGSGPSGDALGQNATTLGQNATTLGQNAPAPAMQTDQPSAAALGKRSDSLNPTPTPPTAVPGQPQDGPAPPAAVDRLQTEASTVSKGRPDRTEAAPVGSSPVSIGRADGGSARVMGSMSGRRESPKGEEAPVPERSQSQAADASRGGRREGASGGGRRYRRSRSPRRSFSRHSSRRGRSISTSSSGTSRSRYSSRSRSRSRSLSRHRSRSWRKSSSRRSRTRSPDRRHTQRSSDRDRDQNRDRDRARGHTRDRSRDRGYPRGRAVGRRPEGHSMPPQRDAKGSQSDRGRGQKALPRVPDKGRGRERDSGSQHQDVRGKEEYPVNAHGVVVSPENIQRARERRQVKSVKGGWLAAENSGLLDTMPHPSTARGHHATPDPSPAVPTAGATKDLEQDISGQKVPQSHAEAKQATAVVTEAAAKPLAPAVPTVTPAAVATATPAAEVPITPAAVHQIPFSGATAAADRPQLQSDSYTTPAHSDNPLAPMSSAKPAAAVEVPNTAVDHAAATAEAAGTTSDVAAATAKAAGTTDSAAATAKAAVTTAEAAAATAASPEATTQDASADIYSPIRSLPSSSALTAPSVPTLATLPPPQLNPLPPPPQFVYQQPANTPGLAPYATAGPDQVAAWQQQQAYQGYYSASYPYTDPSYGYTDPSYGYAHMTQPHTSYGVPTSAPVVSAAQPLPGNVPPPRPPPLGPMSPPPKRPATSMQFGGAASSSQPGPQAGQPATALPQGYPGYAPFGAAAQTAAVTASQAISGAAGPTEKKKISLEDARHQRLNERGPTKKNRHAAHDALPRSDSEDEEAVPSQLPFRDTSSSDSGRAGQNGARAGPNAPQSRASQQPFRRGTAEASHNRGSGGQAVRRRLDRPEEVRSGLDRESSKSGDSSGVGPGLKGNMQRAAGPSRLGPGRGNVRPAVPSEREPVINGRKRRLQTEAAGSGSQGSHHSPRAAAGSPLKKQKTGNLPTQPASTGVGFGDVPPDGITALLAFLSNTKQEDMLKAKPQQLAHQAAQLMGKAEAAERHPKGFKGARGLHYAFQASLLYLHHAAVLQDRRGPRVNVRLLEALKQAVEALELTMRMHASAWEGFCNPLQKIGLTLLLEKLLHAALSLTTQAELPLMQAARASVKMAMKNTMTVTLGWQAGTASGAFQRAASKGSVPEDTLMEDLQAQAASQDRMIKMAQLAQKVSEHMAVVRTLVKSPLHGLKPEREEVLARLSCTDHMHAEKLVDWVFLARKAMLTLYRLAPEF